MKAMVILPLVYLALLATVQAVSSEAPTSPVSNEVDHQTVSGSQRNKNQASEKAVQKQVRQLMKMKCRPVRQKVAVRDVLSPENDLLDKTFLPHVIVVRRCLDLCSYCGSDLGREVDRCQPTKTKKKRFSLYYYDANGQKRYGHFRTQEHRRCGCLSPAAHTADSGAGSSSTK